MSWFKKIYRRQEAVLQQYLFPLILLFYPLIRVTQGVDVSDSTYSLANFLYFERMEGMWVVSTYLSNVTGWFLTHLPFGDTLLGMNIYTGLVVSATVLMIYVTLRKWMPSWIVFTGEMIAIGFCWIPTVILYNYLTYFLFVLGTLLLYRGLVEEKKHLLFFAGLALGANVFVRIPNLTEMALIIGLWYYLWKNKKTFSEILRQTGICLAGYAVGAGLPLIAATLQYGVQGILEMVTGLQSIQSADATYSPLLMITTVIDAYMRTSKWVVLSCICVVMGMAMFAFRKGDFLKIKKGLYVAGLLVFLRFLWGRGMFSFRYYEDYTSIYEWGMLGLYLTLIAGIHMLISAYSSLEEKLMAVLTLVILAITPLGSNNYTFQNLNNLFLLAPFTLYSYVKLYRRRGGKSLLWELAYPWKAMVVMVGIMIVIQSVGFHWQFAFRDGMDGTPRTAGIADAKALAGMKTTKANAVALEGLTTYIKEADLAGTEVILYGNCPGLSFLLEMPFAIDTAWPDLDSFPVETFQENLRDIEETGAFPAVIMRDVSAASEYAELKREYLLDFLQRNRYEVKYNNTSYSVYTVED